MKQQSANAAHQTLWQTSARAWDRFWFTPADPTVLGAIRICCGLITLYTTLAYAFNPDQFIGPHGWMDVEGRLNEIREKAVTIGELDWDEIAKHRPPVGTEQEKYASYYLETWHQLPPGEYPTNNEDAKKLDDFRRRTGVDLRSNGLPIPTSEVQWDYALRFALKHGYAPGAPYPRGLESGDETEELAIERYIDDYGIDPRLVYAKGMRVWSLWLHVTDAGWMMFFQWLIVLITLLFTLGFCTRITSVLTWLAAVSYIHRNSYMLFGVDTMMNILLIYLMIGPSGAALSLDRLLARWWSTAKPGIVNRWRSFWRLAPVTVAAPPPPPANPVPSVSANVAIRLIQIHVCIIYLIAGLAKLQGRTWWDGTAVWGTVANFEFAPMQYDAYNWVLRMLGKNRFAFELFMTVSTYFTLLFEIGYAFLIWRPSLRWVILGMAIVLHGFIGLFMGLKTFSLMMLVMNMAFLKPGEVRWALSWFAAKRGAPAEPRAAEPRVAKTPEPDVLPAERSAAFRATIKEPAATATEAIKRKKSG